MRGGYRPGSGPAKGTKYKPRANKVKNIVPKIPKKRGRPPKLKVDAVVISAQNKIVAAIVDQIIPPTIQQPTSLAPDDIVSAAAAVNLTPLDYLLSVMNNPAEDQNIRIRVAGMIAPFVHPKAGETTGKKEIKEDRAKEAGLGKFKSGRAPLTLVK
jgi:hypothetical protein